MASKFQPLKILFVAAEVAPYTKFGGLADVAWALPRELKSLGHDVKIIIPKYGSIDTEKFNIKKYRDNIVVKTKSGDIVSNIYKGIIPDNIEVFLVENREYYELRSNVYGYSDDARRFMLLSLAALEFVRGEDFNLDVIHANDWHTGYLPNLLKTVYKNDEKLNSISTVFTIHNLSLQGINKRALKPTEIDQGNSPLPDLMSDDINKINGLLRGIIYSDFVNTVSERYAREILTPEFGEGLDPVLKEMRYKLTGIRNGLDYKVLSPDVDTNIYVNYDLNSIEKKVENKIEFQKEFDLEVNPDIPLIGFVGRLTEMKGLGLMHDTLGPLLENLNFQFCVVGGGDEYWENFFLKLIEKYPKKVAGHVMISTTFAQKLFAATDIFLYPSKFEPCGIAHAIAMRFGSVPIVRETGGLADSVVDVNKYPDKGEGFMFKEYDKMEFLIQLIEAITIYKYNRGEWNRIRERAMKRDLSWKNSAIKYVHVYEKAIDKHDKWMKRENLRYPDNPGEVPGYSAMEVLS